MKKGVIFLFCILTFQLFAQEEKNALTAITFDYTHQFPFADLKESYGDNSSDGATLPDKFPNNPAAAVDTDNDGLNDLFVGGRVLNQQYPMPASSRLFRNTGTGFTDVTKRVAPDLLEIGMVTDMLWTDINSDGLPDMILVGDSGGMVKHGIRSTISRKKTHESITRIQNH